MKAWKFFKASSLCTLAVAVSATLLTLAGCKSGTGTESPQLPEPEPDVSCLNAENPDLRIYPNPSDGKFFVEFTGTDDHLVKVFDMLGNEVTDITTAGSNTVVDLTGRSAGIYVVRVISNGNKVVTKRIIKK